MDWALSQSDRRAVYRAIESRRDIRNFRPDPVPEAALWRILEAAHQAPSVGLTQPWNFTLIRSPELKREVYDHFREVNERASSVHPGAKGETYRALKLQGILDAPVNLLVTSDRSRGGADRLGCFTMPQMDEYSTCLAIQNLWLAARAEGIGVGWMSLFEPDFIAKLCRLPSGVQPIAYLTMGFPVEFPPRPVLDQVGWAQRRPLASFVFRDRFGEVEEAPLPDDGSVTSKAPLKPQSRVGSEAAEQAVMRAVRARLDGATKPPGSLGELEQLAIQLATIQRTPHPQLRGATLLLFAGDHGATVHGISAYRQVATTQLVYQYLSGGAAANVLARQAEAEIRVVDVGVDHDFEETAGLLHYKVRRGTRDFLSEPAMSFAEVEQALQAGRKAVGTCVDTDVVVLGEMGIGNTTSASALLCLLTGMPPADCVGSGTGVVGSTRANKLSVVERAAERYSGLAPTEALGAVGGLEIAALVGAIEQAAALGKAVVLDGFIVGVAALVATQRQAGLGPFLLAAHQSAEPGHAEVLRRLGLRPLLRLGLRLGEGTGGLLALPLLRSAATLLAELKTYEESNIDEPRDPGASVHWETT